MITTVYFWRTKAVFIPLAIIFMAINKIQLKRLSSITFIKLLGTGKGESFTPKDADPFPWGMLLTLSDNQMEVVDNSFVVKSWRKICTSEYRVILKPISSHGFWSSKQPFSVDKFEWIPYGNALLNIVNNQFELPIKYENNIGLLKTSVKKKLCILNINVLIIKIYKFIGLLFFRKSTRKIDDVKIFIGAM